jgi:acylphosphatase
VPTRRLLIHGRVQGVWFRESMRQEALRLGVTGWVKNLRDGNVEAVISGETGAVNDIVAWVHRGPEQARVDKVEVEEATGEFSSFGTRPSA